MALGLLLAATLLLVSLAAADPPSDSLQPIIEQLSAACLQGAGTSDVFQEIRSGQKVLQDMLTALQNQLTPAPEKCPDGWSRHEDSCYLIPPQRTSWYRAHHHCASLDRRARLASVQPSSSPHIKSLVAATSSAWGVWISLVKLESDDWGWSDGSPLVFTDWSRNEPSGDGDCVHFFGPGDSLRRGAWNDILCTRRLNLLCQITLK